jgi:hypothetical protein
VLHLRHISLFFLISLVTLAGFFWWDNSTTRVSASVNLEYVVHLPVIFKKDFDLKVTDVKVIQGITVSDPYSVFIANRDTEVRVFVGTGSGKKVKGVSAKLCGYNDQGEQLGCVQPENNPIVAPSFESNLAGTINFELPAEWAKP